jgi:hypothetical protein
VQLKEKYVVNFSQPDSEADAVLTGWEPPFGDLRWARGRRTKLTLPRPATEGALILLLTVEPFLFPPVVQQQTLRVQANGVTVRLIKLRHRTSFTCRLGPDVLGACEEIEFIFDHPDVIRPDMISNSNDSRYYSIGFVSLSLLETPLERPLERLEASSAAAPVNALPALPPLASLTDGDLLGYFCSLGDNCEFGLKQRRAGIEPMDLLRFTGMQYKTLLDGIAAGFAAVEDYEQFEFQLYSLNDKREYVTKIRAYQFESHSGIFEGESTAFRLISRELKKFKVLRRLFLADLAQSNRIFLYKCNHLDAGSDLSALFRALRCWGDASLLVVVQADAAHPPGTVERIEPGFMRGYLDRFNSYDDASAPSSPLWFDICRAAYELWRDERMACAPALELAAT